MSALSNEFNAINLSKGFPNFNPSDDLISLVGKCFNENTNQYALMPGLPLLRDQVVEKIQKTYNVLVNPDNEVTITVGATKAIFNVIAAFIWPNDEVIIIEPCYDCYKPAVNVVGGRTIVYRMEAPEFKINWRDLGAMVTNKTKMICISSPNNLTGTVFNKDDMQQLIAIVKDTDILIMSDEVYEHMVFDGVEHESPLKYPDLRERTFSIFSFGKTLHITGWKIGYCVAPADLTKEMRKVHQNSVFSVAHPLQKAIALYLQQSESYLGLSSFYQKKRDLLLENTVSSRLKPLLCAGFYFQLFDYSNISNENDFDFCVRLIKEHGVAAIPLSRLHSDLRDDKLIRLCFAKTDKTLINAGQKLSSLL